MLKKVFAAAICTFMLLCVNVLAAELKAGDTAYVVYNGTVSVTKNPAYSGNIAEISRGARVTILEAYVIGEADAKFHKVELQDGTVGYVLAYETSRETKPILDTGEDIEKELNKQWETSDTDKYQHAIEMTFLSDYIYGCLLYTSRCV